MKKKPIKSKLTMKEAKAVQVYLETGNQSEAIRQAYPTSNPDHANVVGAQVFARTKVKAEVQKAMKSLGITPEQIIGRFNKMAESSRNEVVRVRSNENLANLSNLYPEKSDITINDPNINVSWEK